MVPKSNLSPSTHNPWAAAAMVLVVVTTCAITKDLKKGLLHGHHSRMALGHLNGELCASPRCVLHGLVVHSVCLFISRLDSQCPCLLFMMTACPLVWLARPPN